MSKMFADWGERSVYTKNNNSTYYLVLTDIMVVYQLVCIFLK